MPHKKKTYTFFVMSDTTDAPKKFVLSSAVITAGVAVFGFVFLLGSSVIVDYVQLLVEKNQSHWLRTENRYLKQQLAAAEAQLEKLEKNIDRVERFSDQLRQLTGATTTKDGQQISTLREPATRESSPMGPIEQAEMTTLHRLKTRRGFYDLRIENVASKTELKEQEMLSLWADLSTQADLLHSTPLMKPASGWISSGYGFRTSPFSGRSSFHRGLDIAADIGTPIKAPANGVITQVGYDKGYGKNMTVDHGHGLVTRYAHCSETNVKVGQKVTRGEVIGAVGNTGRSTGPHLHYEVRLNGVRVNPAKYILE